MAGNAGGMSSVEGIEVRFPTVVVAEARGLQLEHRAVAAAQRHQLVVTAELDHPAVLQDADAIRVAHRGETMRDQNGGGLPRGLENPIEDLCLPAYVELRGGLVEQHQTGTE